MHALNHPYIDQSIHTHDHDDDRRGRDRDVREGPPEPAQGQRAGRRGLPAAPHDQAPGTCMCMCMCMYRSIRRVGIVFLKTDRLTDRPDPTQPTNPQTGQPGHRPRTLPDGGLLLLRRGAAALHQLPLRHLRRAQREPHQHGRAPRRAGGQPPPHQHRVGLGAAAQRVCRGAAGAPEARHQAGGHL